MSIILILWIILIINQTDLQDTLGSQEEVWEAQARRLSHSHASSSSGKSLSERETKQAVKIYTAAISKIPTGRMFDYYINFLEEQVSQSSPVWYLWI